MSSKVIKLLNLLRDIPYERENAYSSAWLLSLTKW